MHLFTGERCLRDGTIRIFDNFKILELLYVNELAAESSFWLYMQLLEPLLVEKPARCVNSPYSNSALRKWKANDFYFSQRVHTSDGVRG